MKHNTRRVALLAGIVLLALLAWQPLRLSYEHYTLRHLFVDGPLLPGGIGPVPGSRFPGLRAFDGDRSVTLLEPYHGAHGTVLVALQSVTENRFCAEQLRQLQHYYPQFQASGIGLVVLTQDSGPALRQFARRNDISIALLHDDAGLSARTLGLASGPGGDPRATLTPGALVIDNQGTVERALFLENRAKRLEGRALLTHAEQALLPASGWPFRNEVLP